MNPIAGKRAVIVGACGGIGRAVTSALMEAGARLVLCDVAKSELEGLVADCSGQGAEITACTVDITDPHAVAHVAEEIIESHGPPAILVNCAGVYISGGMADLTLRDWDWVLSTNLFGVIHVCHAFVPAMIKHGEGGVIINLVSMYGYWPSPNVIGYLTSKFALFGFSEALREDLRPHNINVVTLCPGMINTGIVQNMRVCDQSGQEPEIRTTLQRIYSRRNYSPKRVARALVRAINGNKKRVFVSPEAHIMYYMERFCPALSRIIARRVARRLFTSASAHINASNPQEDVRRP